MNRFLSLLFVALPLVGCKAAPDEDLATRVAAIEARYHTQARQIEELQAAVAELKAAKPAPVIDLVEPAPPQ